jgi:hypothetical protein
MYIYMEQVNAAVSLQTCILEVLDSILGRDTDCPDFLSPFSLNAATVAELGHDRFLTNPFQFIVHQPYYH